MSYNWSHYASFAIIFFFLFSCKTHTPQDTSVRSTVETGSYVINPADSLDYKIGQMVMIGINDKTELKSNDPLVTELQAGKIGGIVLFEKNISKTDSKNKLKQLITELQKNTAIPLFISIDEEGGRVHRLKEKYGFISMPSAAHLGKLDHPDSTRKYNLALSSLLNNLGINLNYAPTVDLATNPENPVIAKIERSFSADPYKVTTHAEAVIEAHHANKVKTVLKHFPGHGSSSTDSHLGLTDVTNQWKAIELIPYNKLIKSGKVDAIMTAHIVNCYLDPECLPATLSKVVITDILRDMLDFEGVVFSDDMQMYAISKNYGRDKAVKLAILAGVDVIMFGNNVNLNDRISASDVHKIIKDLVDSGEISAERIDASYRRIINFKRKQFIR